MYIVFQSLLIFKRKTNISINSGTLHCLSKEEENVRKREEKQPETLGIQQRKTNEENAKQ